MTSTVVLVGGQAHGRRVTFTADQPPQVVHVPTGHVVPVEVTSFADVRVRAVPGFMEREVYRRGEAYLDGEVRWVMVAEDTTVTLGLLQDALNTAAVSAELDERLASMIVEAWQPSGWAPSDGVQKVKPVVHDDPLGWHKCKGTAEDPHEEVLWEGGPDCWVCGRPGEACYPPKLKDQGIAPYGWGGDRPE